MHRHLPVSMIFPTKEAECYLPFLVCCGGSRPLEPQLTSTVETSDWTLHHKGHRDPCRFRRCWIPPPTRHQRDLYHILTIHIDNKLFLCTQRIMGFFFFFKHKHIVSGYDTGNKFDERRLGSTLLSMPSTLTVRAAHVDNDLQGRLLGCQQGRCLPQLLLTLLDMNKSESTSY